MVPAELEDLVHRHSVGDARCTAPQTARLALARLGVPPDSEFYQFCTRYKLGSLLSSDSSEQLVDLYDPSEDIALGTRFIHDVWKLPIEYICLTKCQGEGAYLYSLLDGAVYDFDLVARDRFISAPIPRWRSFYTFLTWHLAGGDEAAP